MRVFRNAGGFTATELLFVATLFSSIPVSGYMGVHQKVREIECQSQLRQVAMAVEKYIQSEGIYLDALFYPEEP